MNISHIKTVFFQHIAFHPTQDPISSTDGTTHALGCGSSKGQASVAVMQPATMAVRRLMPAKFERLQGFPNGYTEIPWRTAQEAKRKGTRYETLLAQRGMTLRGPSLEECPDSPRYKAISNSWAVPVVRWIGARIDFAIKGKS